MPRPKGSKNKEKKPVIPVENLEDKIELLTSEIGKLTDEIKAKKAELKEYLKVKEAQLKEAAAKKAEEEKATILAAFEESGKSAEEVLEFLKK